MIDSPQKEAIRRLPIPVLWQKLGLLGTVNNYCCFRSRDDKSLAIVFSICPHRLCWVWRFAATGHHPARAQALLKVASDDSEGAILFAHGAGTRLGDVANLRWSDLDVANGIVVFREQKTGSKAVIGLHPDFLDWLAELPAPGPGGAGAPVFPALAGKPLNGAHGLSSTFVALLDRAGIEKRLLRSPKGGKGRSVRALTFHSFRHTAATQVFNQAALKEITCKDHQSLERRGGRPLHSRGLRSDPGGHSAHSEAAQVNTYKDLGGEEGQVEIIRGAKRDRSK